jgi:hypothetical protein
MSLLLFAFAFALLLLLFRPDDQSWNPKAIILTEVLVLELIALHHQLWLAFHHIVQERIANCWNSVHVYIL